MLVYWIFAILVLAIMATAVVAAVAHPRKSRTAERRRRYALDAQNDERIPLAPEREPATRAEVPDQGTPIWASSPQHAVGKRLIDMVRASEPRVAEDPPAPALAVAAKLVQTPDGEAILTAPPFALRSHIFTRRIGRYYNGLSRRLPAWVVACPRMRLETLVTPTPPDGRDPDDWAQWRRRVRLRAIDIVIVDRRRWKPVLAIMLEPSPGVKFSRAGSANGTSTALAIGGGQDRMIDEVLAHVGLPLVRGSGDLAQDWAMIEPYINESILRTVSDDEALAASDAAASRPDPDAAVNLLRMDADKGWMLE